ncbi:hypothetical protein MKEN_00856600 [Mycena kentingensis (nom. inval.)]|nr:hypothetical protein MKEN_00856600 [Mycena kentingensis (nom. inval.)]
MSSPAAHPNRLGHPNSPQYYASHSTRTPEWPGRSINTSGAVGSPWSHRATSTPFAAVPASFHPATPDRSPWDSPYAWSGPIASPAAVLNDPVSTSWADTAAIWADTVTPPRQNNSYIPTNASALRNPWRRESADDQAPPVSHSVSQPIHHSVPAYATNGPEVAAYGPEPEEEEELFVGVNPFTSRRRMRKQTAAAEQEAAADSTPPLRPIIVHLQPAYDAVDVGEYPATPPVAPASPAPESPRPHTPVPTTELPPGSNRPPSWYRPPTYNGVPTIPNYVTLPPAHWSVNDLPPGFVPQMPSSSSSFLPVPVTTPAPPPKGRFRLTVALLCGTLTTLVDEARILEEVPQQVYWLVLLRIPSFYFSRVSRIFEDARLSMPDIKRMARARSDEWKSPESLFVQVQSASHGLKGLSSNLVNFKSSWESFVDGLMREFKTLNVISVLLLSAILTLLQIDAASHPITRTAALFSLLCSLISLLYGCIYIIRFGTMKKLHKASSFAMEARNRGPNVYWNVWIMLAMTLEPATWLSWSIIAFLTSIMSFYPPTAALGPRIALSAVFALGVIYFGLIVREFNRYGEPLDREWMLAVKAWRNEYQTHYNETEKAAAAEATNTLPYLKALESVYPPTNVPLARRPRPRTLQGRLYDSDHPSDNSPSTAAFIEIALWRLQARTMLPQSFRSRTGYTPERIIPAGFGPFAYLPVMQLGSKFCALNSEGNLPEWWMRLETADKDQFFLNFGIAWDGRFRTLLEYSSDAREYSADTREYSADAREYSVDGRPTHAYLSPIIEETASPIASDDNPPPTIPTPTLVASSLQSPEDIKLHPTALPTAEDADTYYSRLDAVRRLITIWNDEYFSLRLLNARIRPALYRYGSGVHEEWVVEVGARMPIKSYESAGGSETVSVESLNEKPDEEEETVVATRTSNEQEDISIDKDAV